MLQDDAEICAVVSIAPHEAAALADACKARALQIAEEGTTSKDNRKAYYYDLLSTAFQAIALASARSLYINAKDDNKVTSAMEVCHD